MLLYYVRHGDPTYDPDELTPFGQRQAEAFCRRIARYGIDRIFSSTSTRAYETAKPLAQIYKKEITQLDWCHEKHTYEDLTIVDEMGKKCWAQRYMPIRRVLAQEKCRRLGSEWYEHPDLKRWRDQFKACMNRVNMHTDELMKELGYEHDREAGMYNIVRDNPERVALFAHADFGRVFLSSLLDISYPEMALRTDMCHTGVTVIEFIERGGVCMPRMLTYSNDAHLYAENLPTHYNRRVFI